jgi:hypothetical protein
MFLRFVWLRCHRKIKHRLHADEAMLRMPLPDLLERWTLPPSDVVEEQWFTVKPKLQVALDTCPIPFRQLEGTKNREYQFSSDTIPAWCGFFADVLRLVKTRAATCDMSQQSIDALNAHFHTLNLLLYNNRAIEMLLTLPSLEKHVNDAMKAAEQQEDDSHLGVHLNDAHHSIIHAITC